MSRTPRTWGGGGFAQNELPKSYDNQQGGPGSYGTSIDMETALDPTSDVILAYKQNGEYLHPDHGFPLRCVALAHPVKLPTALVNPFDSCLSAWWPCPAEHLSAQREGEREELPCGS